MHVIDSRHASVVEATDADVAPAAALLAAAFAEDGITGFLFGSGSEYPARVTRFFTLLMQARLALDAPVLLVREGEHLLGAVMGYTSERPPWPAPLARAWDAFEASVPGMRARMAVYDGIAERFMPGEPHYYLGVIGVDPRHQGRGVGRLLIEAFCARSAADPGSRGVYLETAMASNLPFYAAVGFELAGEGRMSDNALWCLYRRHAPGPAGPG